jgi:hypothetical protein
MSAQDSKQLKAEILALHAKIAELVKKDPRKAATILTAWTQNSAPAGQRQAAKEAPPSIKQLKKKAG